jgi:hypothetical protein
MNSRRGVDDDYRLMKEEKENDRDDEEKKERSDDHEERRVGRYRPQYNRIQGPNDPPTLHYHHQVLKSTFNQWSNKFTSKRLSLRRNLGRLSRLARRTKMRDAFSRLPGYWDMGKVMELSERRA